MHKADVSCKKRYFKRKLTMLIKNIVLGACVCSLVTIYGSAPAEQNLPILEEALPVELIQQHIAEYIFDKSNPLTQWLMQRYQQLRETPIFTLSGPHGHTRPISSVAISPDGSLNLIDHIARSIKGLARSYAAFNIDQAEPKTYEIFN